MEKEEKRLMEIRANGACGYYDDEIKKMWRLKDYIPKNIFSELDPQLRANKATSEKLLL